MLGTLGLGFGVLVTDVFKLRWIFNFIVKQPLLVKAKVSWSFIAPAYCILTLTVLMCFSFPAPLHNSLVFWRLGWKKRFRAGVLGNSYLLIAGNQFKHIQYKSCVTAGTNIINQFGTGCLLWLMDFSKLPRTQVTGMTFPSWAWHVVECCANVLCALHHIC